MAHYAFLNENNVVTEVITGRDENEDIYDWERFYGQERGQVCKRTSYNTIGGIHKYGGTPFRKNYAGIGYTYDPIRDAFIPPKPFPSWVLDEETCCWDAPIPMPADKAQLDAEGNPIHYAWDEETLQWVR